MRNPREILFKIDSLEKLVNIQPTQEIRRLGLKDRRIFNRHLRLCAPKSKWLFLKGYSKADWQQLFDSDTEYFCLFAGGKPVSRCAVERYSDKAWEAADIKTAKEYRGRGYTKQLVCHVTREILENGRAATVSTLPENTVMLRVIAALGYEELGVTGDGAILENYLTEKKK